MIPDSPELDSQDPPGAKDSQVLPACQGLLAEEEGQVGTDFQVSLDSQDPRVKRASDRPDPPVLQASPALKDTQGSRETPVSPGAPVPRDEVVWMAVPDIKVNPVSLAPRELEGLQEPSPKAAMGPRALPDPLA